MYRVTLYKELFLRVTTMHFAQLSFHTVAKWHLPIARVSAVGVQRGTQQYKAGRDRTPLVQSLRLQPLDAAEHVVLGTQVNGLSNLRWR